MRNALLPTTVTAIAASLVLMTPGSASAQTVHTEQATPSGTPSIDANCAWVSGGGHDRGIACFKASGDKFYVKDLYSDGHHVEVRGEDNVSGDGYRCWENGGTAAGWQVCDSFWDDISENATVSWVVSVYEGSDILWSGPFKFSNA
ncbi:hypothetical protein ABZ896_33675 [Streptomyces sp. NPDC047072]|uniref:hypothetical protein n=1 Tax=Streptomyces sp. NPDC047072 TaxID=3154809 RepID=UPI0034018043